jgi:hypothetical protein
MADLLAAKIFREGFPLPRLPVDQFTVAWQHKSFRPVGNTLQAAEIFCHVDHKNSRMFFDDCRYPLHCNTCESKCRWRWRQL